ncbi:MAG TPA: hypothetical protein VFR03_04370 [Thermoanaerobaculia bacterium]|nr:hypothetical protein [Thermoanaerobaculia bacterium]
MSILSRRLANAGASTNCAPRLADYLDDPPLLYKLICGSAIGATYRLRGPGADPALIPFALAGRVEESAIPKIQEIVERQFAADPELV